jgi:hypothetical protein
VQQRLYSLLVCGLRAEQNHTSKQTLMSETAFDRALRLGLPISDVTTRGHESPREPSSQHTLTRPPSSRTPPLSPLLPSGPLPFLAEEPISPAGYYQHQKKYRILGARSVLCSPPPPSLSPPRRRRRRSPRFLPEKGRARRIVLVRAIVTVPF